MCSIGLPTQHYKASRLDYLKMSARKVLYSFPSLGLYLVASPSSRIFLVYSYPNVKTMAPLPYVIFFNLKIIQSRKVSLISYKELSQIVF